MGQVREGSSPSIYSGFLNWKTNKTVIKGLDQKQISWGTLVDKTLTIKPVIKLADIYANGNGNCSVRAKTSSGFVISMIENANESLQDDEIAQFLKDNPEALKAYLDAKKKASGGSTATATESSTEPSSGTPPTQPMEEIGSLSDFLAESGDALTPSIPSVGSTGLKINLVPTKT